MGELFPSEASMRSKLELMWQAVELIRGTTSFEEPKTPQTRRSIALPASRLPTLREHRARHAAPALERGSRHMSNPYGDPGTGGGVRFILRRNLAAVIIPTCASCSVRLSGTSQSCPSFCWRSR